MREGSGAGSSRASAKALGSASRTEVGQAEPFRLALTGSIAMGKSTAAAMFAADGVPVFDADATVHALYAGRAAPLIEAAFPGTVRDGVVDRQALGRTVLGDASAMARLEGIVHPLVAEARAAFLARAKEQGADVVLLDIPLLFETGQEGMADAVAVVSAPADVQRARALARPGMTADKLDAILARQVPDAEKRARADYVIRSDEGMEAMRGRVRAVVEAVLGR